MNPGTAFLPVGFTFVLFGVATYAFGGDAPDVWLAVGLALLGVGFGLRNQRKSDGDE